MSVIIQIQNVRKVYDTGEVKVEALRGVSFDIVPVSYTHLTLPTIYSV